jgi:hypothetical protein
MNGAEKKEIIHHEAQNLSIMASATGDTISLRAGTGT